MTTLAKLSFLFNFYTKDFSRSVEPD